MTDKEPKFTPGPWEPGRSPAMATVLDGHEGKAIYPKGANRHIAWANVYDEEGELCMDEALANAALIAAAPMMYDFIGIARKFLPVGIAILADMVMMRARGEHLEEQDEDSDQQ